MQFDGLHGKTVLVTGASSGIGRSIATMFSAAGSSVALHYSHGSDAVFEIKSLLDAQKNSTAVFQADLTKCDSVAELYNNVIKEFGKIDILVNNAGAVVSPCYFADISKNELLSTLALNFMSPFLLSGIFFEHMKSNGGGKIINISSIGVKYGGTENTLHYACAKGALETMTVGYAKFGAPFGVLVNAIRPGVINTSFHKATPEKNMEQRLALIPLRRMGEPMDIAEMVCYLASDAGNYITGQVIGVAGGE